MIPARDDFKNFKIFDDHFHIIDRRFPLISNSGYLHADFTCEDYSAARGRYLSRWGRRHRFFPGIRLNLLARCARQA
jgi:hypothetical protein